MAISRALIMDPPVLLADEPTGNLDSKTGREVMGLLRGAVDQRRTVILVTHDPRMARVADRVLTIADGELASDERVAPESVDVVFAAAPPMAARRARAARRACSATSPAPAPSESDARPKSRRAPRARERSLPSCSGVVLMWTLLREVSLRHLRHSPLRSGLVVLGISLGVCMLTAVLATNDSLVFRLRDMVDRVAGKADLTSAGSEAGFPAR